MKKFKRFSQRFRPSKAQLLAAASLAAVVSAPALAADDAASAPPQEAMAVYAPPVVEAAAPSEAEENSLAHRLGYGAAAAAVGALILKLIGWKSLKKAAAAAGPAAARAAESVASASASAAKVVGRTVKGPFRWLAAAAGLILTALLGAGFYDVEWLGGMIVGAALVGFGANGIARARKAAARLVPIARKSPEKRG